MSEFEFEARRPSAFRFLSLSHSPRRSAAVPCTIRGPGGTPRGATFRSGTAARLIVCTSHGQVKGCASLISALVSTVHFSLPLPSRARTRSVTKVDL